MQICKKFLPLHSQSARDVYYRFTLHYKKENLVAERNLGDFFITFASSSPALPITKAYVDSGSGAKVCVNQMMNQMMILDNHLHRVKIIAESATVVS